MGTERLMHDENWAKELNVAITVCDENGIIIDMNKKAFETFSNDGGESLIGANLFDCHPQHAKDKLHAMIKDKKSNTYTIEKKGIKKMIHQTPYYVNNEFKGFVELSFEIPFDMPHFIRKQS